MEEIWKVYKTTGGNRYHKLKVWEVSNLGRVKLNGEIVEPHANNGYLRIGAFFIHRAVADLFIPNPENKPSIDHINTIKTDNRAENLRWVTCKENMNNSLTRMRNSESHKGRIPWNKGLKLGKGTPHTEETKRKIAESLKGKPSGMKGKTQTEETKRKISEARKGKSRRPFSEETKTEK